MSDLFRSSVPRLMNRLMADMQCSALDAAAVFGNAGHESNGFRTLQEIKPTVAGSRGGFGWFQWTGPRRRAFEAFCAKRKLKPSSEEANYGFLVTELHGDEAAAMPATKRAKTLRDKVIAFEMGYERAGVKHYDSRTKWAQIALDAYTTAGGQPVAVKKPVSVEKKSAGAVLAGGSAATAAHQSGLSAGWVVGIALAVMIAAFVIIHFWKKQ